MPPKIDFKKCRRCGVCVYQCGKHVFKMHKNAIVEVRIQDCVDCFICEIYCPVNAITIYLKEKGCLA